MQVTPCYSGLRFTFLFADQYRFTRAWVFPASVVPYSLLRLVRSGRAEFTLGDEVQQVLPGDIVHIPEGTTLSCRALSDDLEFISIRFMASVKYGEADFLSEYLQVPSVTRSAEAAAAHFTEILDAVRSSSPGREFRVRGLLELLVASLVDASGGPGTKPVEKAAPAARRNDTAHGHDPRIDAVVSHLIHHPSEPLVMDELCLIATLSPSALRRLFKAQMGMTLSQFRAELTMTTAARWLLVTNDRVGEIALRLGFSDQNYFTRCFRQVFGVPPLRYRKLSREQA
ncbi:MAG: AraC family transcriptional regulator [Propionibacteriaceae bacterium]|nr:AraC family transcriptional regulator [Propionibacteriaceae bacterium]